MRGEMPGQRGECGRVAGRVRQLLGEHARRSGRGRWVAPELAGEQAHSSPELVPTSFPDRHGRLGGRASRPSLGQRLAARVPVRLDPGRRAAVAVGLAVLLAAALTGGWVMSARPRALAVSASTPPVPGASALIGTDGAPGPGVPPRASAGPAAASPTPLLVVDVAGKVRHPGLYRLTPGSRVDDALTAAGGPLVGVNLSSLNLAAKVVDGQQIAVGLQGAAGGVPAAAGPGSGAPAAPGSSAGGPVDLNTASLEQLETLPGVGPVLGQYILDWRTAHGSFTTIDQLGDVTGIGDVKFATLRPLVTV